MRERLTFFSLVIGALLLVAELCYVFHQLRKELNGLEARIVSLEERIRWIRTDLKTLDSNVNYVVSENNDIKKFLNKKFERRSTSPVIRIDENALKAMEVIPCAE